MIYFYYLLIYKCKVSVPNSQLGIIFFHLVFLILYYETIICLLQTFVKNFLLTTRLFFDMIKSTERGENFGRNKR